MKSETDQAVRKAVTNSVRKIVVISAGCGVAIAEGIRWAFQDALGKAEYLRHAEQGWIDFHWSVGVCMSLFFLAVLLMAETIYRHATHRVIIRMLETGYDIGLRKAAQPNRVQDHKEGISDD